MTDTVLVAGSGPVGLTMALELTRYGVPVRLVDKMSVRSTQSRACAVWTRTLELLDRAGVSNDLIAKGNKVDAANIFAGKDLLVRLDIGRVESPYPYVLMIPQNDTEAILERHVAALGAKDRDGRRSQRLHPGRRRRHRHAHPPRWSHRDRAVRMARRV